MNKMNCGVLLISLLVTVSVAIECPDDWVSFHGSCYLYVNDVTTWTGAQTVCGLLHSVLVEIETPEENDFIVGQMALRNVFKAWTGLNDFEHEGQFVWTSTMEIAEYTNWATGEPNDDAHDHALGDQDCGAIYPTGLWDDEWCETTAHQQTFFCEMTSRGGPTIIG